VRTSYIALGGNLFLLNDPSQIGPRLIAASLKRVLLFTAEMPLVRRQACQTADSDITCQTPLQIRGLKSSIRSI
jgi:hypothetical protein